ATNPLAIWPFVSSSNFQVRFGSSPATRGAARTPSITRLAAEKVFVIIVAPHRGTENSEIRSPDHSSYALSDRLHAGLVSRCERDQMAEHAGNRPFALEQIDEIVSREPTRLQPAAKRLHWSRI